MKLYFQRYIAFGSLEICQKMTLHILTTL